MAKDLLKPITILNAKPADKDQRFNDGSGLCLLIKTNGAKWWRFNYTFEGKRKTLSLGVFPVTTLADARRKAEEARKQVSNNINPSNIRKETKATKKINTENENRIDAGLPIKNSFADLANQWLMSIEHLIAERTLFKKTRRLELHAFPVIGNIAINQIKSSDVLASLKPLIDKKELSTAHRLRGELSSIFDYAIVHNFTDYDPAQSVAKQIPAEKVKHRAGIIDPYKVGQLLRDISNYNGTFVVQLAFRISPLLFQRPGEIRQLLWSDIDLEAREWRPYISKTDFHHIVPLSTQAIAILEEIKPLTGAGKYVFPSSRGDGRPMSDGTIRTALKSLGYDSDVMTAHGFRTTVLRPTVFKMIDPVLFQVKQCSLSRAIIGRSHTEDSARQKT
jgi:integrase